MNNRMHVPSNMDLSLDINNTKSRVNVIEEKIINIPSILTNNQLLYYTSDNNKLTIVDWRQGFTPGSSDWAYNPTQHIINHVYNTKAKYGIITFDTNTIPDGLFISQPTLLKVDMADNIIYIGAEAFCNCTNLKEIRLSNTLKAIGYAAFYKDSGLESIYIPDSVVTMHQNPDESDTFHHGNQFMNCESLDKVRLSKNMTEIPEGCFWNCYSLSSIYFPNSIEKINGSAFTACRNVNNIVLGSNVKTIGQNVFNDCISIKSFKTLSTKLTSFNNNMIIRAHIDTFEMPSSITECSSIFLNVSTINHLIFPTTFTHFTVGHNAAATIRNIDFSGDSVTNFPRLNNKLETVILRKSALVTGLDELIPSSIITIKLQIYVPTDLIESYKSTYSYLSDYFFKLTGDSFISRSEVKNIEETLNTNIDNLYDSINDTIDNTISINEKGTANGVATLDERGKVPSSQLPSYVDDIIDVYAVYAENEIGQLNNIVLFLDSAHTQMVEGESGKIYQNITENQPPYQFRWTGTTFSQVGATQLIIGEVAGTAYDGAKGKASTDNINKVLNTTLSGNIYINTTTDKVTISYDTYNADKYGNIGDINIKDIPAATENKAGVITANDKTKLNSLPTSESLTSSLNSKVDKIEGKSLVNDTLINKLTGLGTAEEITTEIESSKSTIDNYTINGKKISTNPVLNKSDIDLANVDNTSDLDKPVSTATQTALETLSNDINAAMIQNTTMLQGDIETVVKEVDGLKYKLGVLQEYHKEPLYTRIYYIIDQRGTISDPDDMVSPNYIKDEDGNLVKISESGATGNPATNLLTWLKLNTHAYVGSYPDNTYETVNLKQLDDNDRTKYINGTSALNDIQGGENGTNDVWVKFPCDIYFRTDPYTPEGETEPNEDYVLVTITTKLLEGENEKDWQKWDKNNLVAVYNVSIRNNKAVSQSNKRIVLDDFITNNRKTRRGKIFEINYQYIKFSTLLFWGYYKTLDAYSIIGHGTVSKSVNNKIYTKLTGGTDKLAKIDTTYETGTGATTVSDDQAIAGFGDEIKATNFWHIEGFIDHDTLSVVDVGVMSNIDPRTSTNIGFLDNYIKEYGYPIIVGIDGKEYQLTEELYNALPNNTPFFFIWDRFNYNVANTDSIIAIHQLPSFNWVTKLKFGKHADLMVKAVTANGALDTYYCAKHTYNYGAWNPNQIAITRGNGNHTYSNINIMTCNASFSISHKRHRLMFYGTEDSINIIG